MNNFYGNVEEYEKNENLRKYEELLKAQKAFYAQKKIADDAKYIEFVMKKNYVDAISSYMTVYDVAQEIVEKAFTEFYEKDKRKSRHNLEWLEHRIAEDFFDNKYTPKIIKLMHYMGDGVLTTAVLVYFQYQDITYELEIPRRRQFRKLDATGLEGKFGIYQRSNCDYVSELLYSSYNISDVKDYILHHIYKEEPQVISAGGSFTKEELINGYEKENKE